MSGLNQTPVIDSAAGVVYEPGSSNEDLTRPANEAVQTPAREAAIALATEGLRVFPLPPRKKQANMPEWQKRATSDRAEIEQWFPLLLNDDLVGDAECNIAVATGNGLLVLDEDPRHGSQVSITDLQSQYSPLPETRTVRTPSGGQHRYFRVAANRRVPNSVSRVGPGLDVRGDGGYVAAPPSVTDKGTYCWENPGAPIADAPQWLIELATKPRAQKEPRNSGTSSTTENPKHNLTRADARSMLFAVIKPKKGEYDEWAQALWAHRRIALSAQDGSNPNDWLADVDEWCRALPEYRGIEEVRTKWLEADKREHGFGLKYLIDAAKAGGYELPARRSDPSVFPAVPPAPTASIDHTLLSKFCRQPEPEWLVEDVLMRGSILAVVFGEPGSGKSTVVLELLLAIARGFQWHGRDVEQGAVAYIAAESVVGLRKRLKAYEKANSIELSSLDECFFPIPSGLNLLNDEDVEKLVQYLKTLPTKHPLRIVAVDTLAQATPGANENTSDGMGPALNACKRINRETGATVLLIAHSGKDQTRGIRGWSGILGALDTEVEVLWDKENDVRLVSVKKQRDGESNFKLFDCELRKVAYDIDSKAREVSSVVVVEVQTQPEQSNSEVKAMEIKQPKTKRRGAKPILDALRTAMRPMTVEAVMDEVVPKLPFEAGVRDQRRGEVNLAIDALRNEGFLTVHNNVVTLVDPLLPPEGPVSPPKLFAPVLAANDADAKLVQLKEELT